MPLGFNSFNMMNTNSNCGLSNMYGNNMCFGNMFGMNNLLGNYGFGGSIFGMGYGSSPFMDCNGYTNYNAMAGFAVGNTLLNFAGMGINYALSNAKSGGAKDSIASELNADLDSCLEDIEEKLEELNITGDANTVLETVITEQVKTDDLKSAEEGLKVLQNRLSSDFATEPASTDTNYKTWHDNKRNLETQIATAEAKVEEAREAQAGLIEELKELIKERDNIKREINEQILNDADGSKARHRNTELNIEDFTPTNNNSGKNTNVTREDIAQLIYLFRNAGTDDDRTKYKAAMENIDDSAFLQVASNDQAKAREIIRNWSAKNSNI